jgi:hypothetical protein
LAIGRELTQQVFGRCHRLSSRDRSSREKGGTQEPVADESGELHISDPLAAASRRGTELRHDPIAVGDEHRLSARGEANILAEPIL